MREKIKIAVLGFDDSVHEVEIPSNKITFMLRHGSAVNTEETKEVLTLIRDYYNNFQFPEYEETVLLWKFVFREYTKEQILWGLYQHAEKNAFPPKANELVEVCEYKRKKQAERFFIVRNEFNGIEESIVRGFVDVTVPERSSVQIADAEEIERARQAFFTRCYLFNSPDGVARSLASAVRGYLVGAEKEGRLGEIKPLHEVIETIEIRG